MSARHQWLLALWGALLVTLLCLLMLPTATLRGVLLACCAVAILACLLGLSRRRPAAEPLCAGLPAAGYRLPLVLCCTPGAATGDDAVQLRQLPEGCWLHLADASSLAQRLRQLLALRPGWGGQLAIAISLTPQHYPHGTALVEQLQALRWQIDQLRRETDLPLPLILSVQVAAALACGSEPLWKLRLPDDEPRLWRAGRAPLGLGRWLQHGGRDAWRQQLLFSTLDDWLAAQVLPVFNRGQDDSAPLPPCMLVTGLHPRLSGGIADNLWLQWLRQRTALHAVAGWQPASTSSEPLAEPDFILPLLPLAAGSASGQRLRRHALSLLALALAAALLCSAGNNHALIRRVAFDLQQLQRTPHNPAALAALHEDERQLNQWARSGEPLRLGLWLYQGAGLRRQVIDAIVQQQQPATLPRPAPATGSAAPAAAIRLDGLSLFDSGSATLKSGSTRVLIQALGGIQARPGWQVRVSGYTDNTGSPQQNQQLSLRRAEAVRDWMRNAGDIPPGCFAVRGYGDSRPVADNATAAGRAANRRVEIQLLPQAEACQAQ